MEYEIEKVILRFFLHVLFRRARSAARASRLHGVRAKSKQRFNTSRACLRAKRMSEASSDNTSELAPRNLYFFFASYFISWRVILASCPFSQKKLRTNVSLFLISEAGASAARLCLSLPEPSRTYFIVSGAKCHSRKKPLERAFFLLCRAPFPRWSWRLAAKALRRLVLARNVRG